MTHDLATPPAVSSFGGLRTPAPGVRRATIMGPASENLHTSGLMHQRNAYSITSSANASSAGGISELPNRFCQQVANAGIDLVTVRLSHAEHGEMRPQAVDHTEFAVRDQLLLGLAISRRKEHVA